MYLCALPSFALTPRAETQMLGVTPPLSQDGPKETDLKSSEGKRCALRRVRRDKADSQH